MCMATLCTYIIRTLIVDVLNTMTVRDFRITCSAAINTDMNREKDLRFRSFSKYILHGCSVNIDMNGRVCSALVQYSCCQHRHK